MKTLSVCMIVRNEEDTLGNILGDVKHFADEKIVVDTGSGDGTRGIALDYGAKVLDYPWHDNFSAARNYSIDQATGDYIVILDADDRLNEKSVERILKWRESLNGSVYAFQISNDDEEGRTHIFNQVRAFPNRPDLRYEGWVHNTIDPAVEKAGLKTVPTRILVVHSGYADEATVRAKHERTLNILEKEVIEKPESDRVHCYLGALYEQYGRYQEAWPHLWKALQSLYPRRDKKPFGLLQVYPAAIRCSAALNQRARARYLWIEYTNFVAPYPPMAMEANSMGEDLGFYDDFNEHSEGQMKI